MVLIILDLLLSESYFNTIVAIEDYTGIENYGNMA